MPVKGLEKNPGFEIKLSPVGFIGLYWVLLGFSGFYWVLLGFIGFYWVLLGFIGVYWGFNLKVIKSFIIIRIFKQ